MEEEERPMRAIAHDGTQHVSELMASVLLRAYGENRTDLYCWERDTLRWLDACYRKGIGVHNDWTVTFTDLNREAIEKHGRMDFNLRAARERKEMV
jgi:hypothetical protein